MINYGEKLEHFYQQYFLTKTLVKKVSALTKQRQDNRSGLIFSAQNIFNGKGSNSQKAQLLLDEINLSSI